MAGISLRDPIDLPVWHLQHAADVAHHGLGLQRSEGDDLGDLALAVLLLDVVDHLAAPVLAEIDIEVRHRHAIRIEEALEQQVVAQRVEVGDGQRIGHQRAGARAAPRTNRNVLRLGPLDEVGDDQEVARILHLDDDAELEFEPLLILGDGHALDHAVAFEPALEPGVRLDAQPLGLGRHALFRGLFGRSGEARQDRPARPRPVAHALRDLD